MLFVVPPLAGHVNPTVGVGAELKRRGHQVAWAGHAGLLAELLPPGARVFPAGDAALDARLLADRERRLTLIGPAALKYFWTEFVIPLGHAMAPGVDHAAGSFAPHAVVVDQQAIAGAVVARRRGLPWATSATTSAELTRPLAALPKVAAWVRSALADFQRAHGCAEFADPRFSPALTLVFSTPALTGPLDGSAEGVAWCGPALTDRPETAPFPWDWLADDRRAVLASLGTLNGAAGHRFYATLIEATRDLPELQLVIVAPPGVVTEAPPHVLVRTHVPQLALLERMAAVVSHGGHNTVCESLAHGVPLVVAPVRDDQPIVAQQVADAGAGVRVRFGRVRAGDLRAALAAVLDDPSYGRAARRIAASFAAAGGASAAADQLERLL